MNIDTRSKNVWDQQVAGCKHPRLRRALLSNQESLSEPAWQWQVCPLAAPDRRQTMSGEAQLESGLFGLISSALNAFFRRF
jgi:hypothetical protein